MHTYIIYHVFILLYSILKIILIQGGNTLNIIVVTAHPYEKSFNRAITDTVVQHLESRGAAIKVKDLVKMNYNPVLQKEDLKAAFTKEYQLDVLKEHEDLLWADAIVNIAPLWWGSMPAVMKGYYERSLTSGFAYGTDQQLAGTRSYTIMTAGANPDYLEDSRQKTMIEGLVDNIFGACGFADIELKLFLQVPTSTDDERQSMLIEAKEFVDQIFDKKPNEGKTAGEYSMAVKAMPKDHMKRKN